MKKIVSLILILLVLLFTSTPIQVNANSQPHPAPTCGNQAEYAGKWIIDGKTEQNTNWTLELEEDGKYKLHNEHHSYEGQSSFIPGNNQGSGDMIILDIDPENGIEITLENTANGLFDVSGQGLVFVRPGNKANIDEFEQLEYYPAEKLVGDWKLAFFVMSTDLGNFELTGPEIMQGSETGDTEVIFSLKDGMISQISLVLEFSVPIARIRWRGRNSFTFKNPIDSHIATYYNGLIYGDNLEFMLLVPDPMPEDISAMFFFDRITAVKFTEETE